MSTTSLDQTNAFSRQVTRRSRAKHTRSSLGCGVCRIRRIRCDQSRPACQKCFSTGRKCDGYQVGTSKGEITAVPETNIAPRPEHDVSTIFGPLDNHNHEEGHLLHYFQHSTSRELAGDFGDEFWCRLVLQLGHREPCVRHMTLALTFLHASFKGHNFSGILTLPTADMMLENAHAHYGKAVQLLNNHISLHGWASLDVTLLCSILCISFESLRGNHLAAMAHLRSSLVIIREWESQSSSLSTRNTSFWSPSGHLIRSQIRPVYTRLVMQAAALIHDKTLLPPAVAERTDEPSPFTTLREAWDSLLELLSQQYLPRDYKTVEPRKPGPRSRREWSFSQHLARWSASLDGMSASTDQLDPAPATVLNIWRRCTRIMLSTRGCQDEIDYDVFNSVFTDILDLTVSLFSNKISSFSADISVVPVLYYVAAKCRHPSTRRRAIRLLESTPRKEGIWDSIGAARLARHIVDLEEDMAGVLVNSHRDVPGEARIARFRVRLDLENRGMFLRVLRQRSEDWGDYRWISW